MTAHRDPAYPGSNSSLRAGRPSGADDASYVAKQVIEAVKDAVALTDYVAARGVELRPAGNTLRGRCPLHAGDSPDAFAVTPDRGTWRCFRGCGGGDVVHLHQRMAGLLPWAAAMDLAQEYGVQLPERPGSWRERRGTKNDARARVEARITERLQDKLFVTLCLPHIEAPENETAEEAQARKADAEELWRVCGTTARQMRQKGFGPQDVRLPDGSAGEGGSK